MKPQRDDSLLPDDAVWVDDATDPVGDAEWLETFPNTHRHYRLYDTYDHRYQTGHPDNRILFGVILIDSDDIETARRGVLSPSPSMIGHLNSLPRHDESRNPESPLDSYSQTGGSNDAFRFGSDVGFKLHGIQIKQDQMRWLSVRPLPPIVRCRECSGILATSLAKQCLRCGADWH